MPISIYHPRYQAMRTTMIAARKAAGLTQVQMAQKLGVGQSYVSKIERGESYVDALTFMDWFQTCGINPGQAFDQLVNPCETTSHQIEGSP